ncbi:MAG: tetratricopeptide repeat protein [Candidatus Eiseniibacteriota bacterium]
MEESPISRSDLLVLLGVAAALRFALIATTAGDPIFEIPMLDAEYSVEWARRAAAGDLLGSPEGTAYFRTPLYTWFLAGAFLLPGPDLTTARLLQALLGAATCVMLAQVAGRRFGRAAGIATGALSATAWPLLYFGRELLIESIVPLLGALILVALDAALRHDRLRGWFALGAAIGLAAVARANFLLIAPAVWLFAAVPAGPRVRRTLALVTGTALCVLPVTVRNRAVSGDWVLLSYQGGLNLWIGNNPEADGMSASLPGFSSWRNEDVDAWFAREQGRAVGPAEQDAHFMKLARGFFAERPADAFRLLAKKTYFFLQGYEIRNNRDLYAVRERQALLRLPLPDFGWILPLAGVGVFVHRRRIRDLLPLLAYGAAAAAGVILFFVCARYRLVAWPALLPLAGAGAAALADRGAGARVLAGRAALLLALVLLARIDFLGIRHPDQSQTHFQTANIHARAGNFAEAEGEFRRALAIQPAFAEAKHHLGALLLEAGRVQEALPLLREAARDMPASFRARRSLAEALEAAGALPEALAVRRETLALSGGAAQDRLALANALGMSGAYGEAWEHYAAMLADEGAADAADPYLLLNAGQTALALRREEEGSSLLGRATKHDETRVPAWEALARYHLSERRPADALRVLSEAVLRLPEDAALRRLRALARWTTGDLTGTLEDLEAAVRLDPSDTASRQRLEELRAGAR